MRGRSSIGFLGLAAAAVVLSSNACTQSASAPEGARIVERSRLAMGSELRITAWTADEAAALSAFETAFGDFQRLDGLMSVWREGSDVVRAERGCGQAAGAGERGGPRGVACGPSGQRLDGREIRCDVWRALGPLEVRSRSGQSHSRSAGSPQAFAAHRLQGGGRERAGGTVFLRREGMRVHLGGIARVTPSIGRWTRCGEPA
jgi:hypothetical protein